MVFRPASPQSAITDTGEPTSGSVGERRHTVTTEPTQLYPPTGAGSQASPHIDESSKLLDRHTADNAVDTSVDNTSVDNTSVDNTSVDNTSVDNTSVDNTSVDNTSVDNTVELCRVNKRFGDVEAISGLDLRIPKAQISVLLGPNGAGKTTAIRLITGALTPDSGSASVFGMSPTGDDGEEIRRRCGIVTAKPSLYDRLSGHDNLQYAADLYGLTKATAPARILEAAEQFDIVDALDQKVGGYSTGMKTRLALARAVLHRPDLLLLDEPTSGLDPESAHSVLALVRDMTNDGKTVLMCTHLLLEAEGLADQIIILQGGSNLLSGVPNDLAAEYWPNRIVELRSPNGQALDHLESQPGTISYQRENDTARVELSAAIDISQLVAELTSVGVALDAVIPFEPTLEDLYLRIRKDHQLAEPQGVSGSANPASRNGSSPHISYDDNEVRRP